MTSLSRRALLAGTSLLAAAPALAGAETQFRTLSVEQSGAGEPLVLIPGLACGAWALEEIARRLSPRFSIHALTLPGFDGRPPIEAPMIPRICADIAAYVAALKRPLLVGHSLGAFIALKTAAAHPKLFGGIVTLDGYPVFPALAGATAEERAGTAQRLAAQFAVGAGDPARFRETLRGFLAARMNDSRQAERFAERAARSDPAATAAYVIEMLSADLRPELTRLDAPLLALAATDSYLAGRSEEEISAFYANLLAKAPKASVLLLREARHFVAVDRPDVVAAAIDSFAAGLRLGRA
ncbi:pimeloyl-ACP methyl ester carboxylesterase [Methylosinus sp. sav-2]|uniref:alpha/beta fold hydrolase n=1 Tax=Methylosinus sp. sav-2 TaxID=2485168 RepID=UPI0004798B0F|nr:alpha/beta hydrolase [Methylosinus sp. sav-2]TDX64940.1 pimeloyl-ACP methyl ester carboxylesterase [Methylosinus sp. sav-2]